MKVQQEAWLDSEAELRSEAELCSAAELMFNKSKTACFTGHRPSGFPFDETDRVRTKKLKSLLQLKVCDALNAGYTTFITGMARGVDTWCALAVLSLKSDHPGLKLVGVSPFRKETDKLSGSDLWDYNTITAYADKMIYISESYYPQCYFDRNMYMVDHSSLVIGAVSDMHSGTGNTIRYAERKGIKTDIISINPFDDILNL